MGARDGVTRGRLGEGERGAPLDSQVASKHDILSPRDQRLPSGERGWLGVAFYVSPPEHLRGGLLPPSLCSTLGRKQSCRRVSSASLAPDPGKGAPS